MHIQLEPIGVVKNEFEERPPDGWETALSHIIVAEKWAPALDGIEGFSHLIILFWLNRIRRREVSLQVHPESRQDLPLVGLFATRTPFRPNPIGLQVVELVSREGKELTVRGLDALNGSPILDIKPYLPRGDAIALAKIPAWLEKLWEEDRLKHEAR